MEGNEFATIAAEDVSREAQMTPEEQGELNAYLDQRQQDEDDARPVEPTPEGEAMNRRAWAMLVCIHEEIAPRLAALQALAS